MNSVGKAAVAAETAVGRAGEGGSPSAVFASVAKCTGAGWLDRRVAVKFIVSFLLGGTLNWGGS